jgi:hypothetical protein
VSLRSLSHGLWPEHLQIITRPAQPGAKKEAMASGDIEALKRLSRSSKSQ